MNPRFPSARTEAQDALAFVVLAFLLAVLVATLWPALGEATPLVTMFTPLAALVCLWLHRTGASPSISLTGETAGANQTAGARV